MTARADIRMVVWITLISVMAGAAYGSFETVAAGGDGAEGVLRGAVVGGLISSILSVLEIFILNGPLGAPFRQMPFLINLTARSAIYVAVILFGLAAGRALVTAATGSDVAIEILGRPVLFSIALSIGFNLLLGVNRLLGQNVLFNFVAGRFHRPRIEERVLLFIDMESSTAIAERLGEVDFLVFLNRFVCDVTDPIVAQRGEIHKYVGDELIVTWTLAAGITEARCIRACFDALRLLAARDASYERKFGMHANFRAALHCGPVVVGEVGSVKMEIALLGDTMNTTARLQQACRDTGCRVLASAPLIARIATLPPGIAKRSLGSVRLRGKEAELELYALEILP